MDTILIRVTAKSIEQAKKDAMVLLENGNALPHINGRMHHYSPCEEVAIIMYFDTERNVIEFAHAQGLESVKFHYENSTDLFSWVEKTLTLNLKRFSHVVELNEVVSQRLIKTFHIKARFKK